MNDLHSEQNIVNTNPEVLVVCFSGLDPNERLDVATGIADILSEITISDLDVLVDAFGSMYARAFSKRRLYSVSDVDCLARLTIFACKNTYVKPEQTSKKISSIKQNRNRAENRADNAQVPELELNRPKATPDAWVVEYSKPVMKDTRAQLAQDAVTSNYL